MSKAIGTSIKTIKEIKNAASKFTPSATPGSRLLPSKEKDDKKNKKHQVRVDAGYYDEKTKKLNVVLQVNSQASSPSLVNFRKKHSTHANLATEQFDTSAADSKAEMERVMDSMGEQAKKNLK